MYDSADLPEGTEWTDFMTPRSADSPVGKGDVARILQGEQREGREAREAGVVLSDVVANCNKSLIMLVRRGND